MTTAERLHQKGLLEGKLDSGASVRCRSGYADGAPELNSRNLIDRLGQHTYDFCMGMNAKIAALESIRDLPESVTFDEIMDRIYLLQKVAAGEASAEEEATVSAAVLKNQMDLW